MNAKRMLRIAAITVIAAVSIVAVQQWIATRLHHAGDSAVIYYCPMHPSYTSARPGTCPICNMSLVKKEPEEAAADPKLHSASAAKTDTAPGTFAHSGHPDEKAQPLYTCPMHPKVISDKPGLCPDCNMKLVPKEEPAEQAASKPPLREVTVEELMNMKPGEICLLHKCKMGHCMIAMNKEFAQLGICPHCGEDLGVTIKNAPPEGYASLHLGAEKQAVLGIKTAPVQRIRLTKTIRTVGRIAYDPGLYQAQEEYLQAYNASQKSQASLAPEIKEQTGKLLESSKIKLRLLGLNEDLINDIETAGKPDRSLLYSEAGGRVWLYAQVYEYELPFVKVGDNVEASVPGISGKKFNGTIRSIDSVLDPMTRSARVRAVLENPDGYFKPEMYADAVLKVDAGERVAVPEEAIFKTGEKNIVFVVNPQGVLEPREVVLGVTTEDYAEIRSGLGEGESVVTNGNFLIDSESRLKAALNGAGESSGGHQHGL